MQPLRPLHSRDLEDVLEVYRDAVLSQAPARYTPEQVSAWAGLPVSRRQLRDELLRGRGLVSCSDSGRSIEAFALLEPLDRVSLLYCRGRSCRQGRATALLQGLEAIARAAGSRRLRTEASFLSRNLFERQGWSVEAEEEVVLAGVPFRRFRMGKPLGPGLAGG